MSSGSYKAPEYCILASAMKHLESGQKVMFLASCSYMLQPMIQVLRKNGIPFHNPYRKANGFWNPSASGDERHLEGFSHCSRPIPSMAKALMAGLAGHRTLGRMAAL